MSDNLISKSLKPKRLALGIFAERIAADINSGARLGLLSARYIRGGANPVLIALILYPERAEMNLLEAVLEPGATHFRSLTPQVTQAHWFERAIYDFFGIRAEGHPRFKSVILHEAWPKQFHPLRPESDQLAEASTQIGRASCRERV